VTSTGKQVIAPESPGSISVYGTDGRLQLTTPPESHDPCGNSNSCSLTVTDSLGSSVTVTLPPAKY
jgi:hypothetical protein